MHGVGRNVVIVGASAAGLRCACRLARLRPDWIVRVVEARETFSYAACGLPYVVSGDVPDLAALHRTEYGLPRDAGFFAAAKGVEVLAGQRAAAIDLHARRLRTEGVQGAVDLPWDDLVLAVGARPRRLSGQPEHPRVRTFHVWDDVRPLKEGLARGEIDHVALVGAGLVGCELAEAFRALWGAEVTLLDAAPHPLPELLDPEMASLVAARFAAEGVRFVGGAPVESIRAGDSEVRVAAGGREIAADAAVVAVGVEPVVELARDAGIELGRTGAIVVDSKLATSVEGIWAAGDCIEVRHAVSDGPAFIPLGSLANRQGRTLANVLAGKDDRFPPVAGASAVKVFDWNVGSVGLTREQADSVGLTARSVWVSSHDRAHYWPEAKEIHLTLVYEPGGGRVLGVQVAGAGDGVKRIDVATQWIVRGGTIEDLAHLEHGYAPPYAPALDPLAVAASVALNQEDGVEALSPDTDLARTVGVDVRLFDEIERLGSPAPGPAVPLPELRSRWKEIPPDASVAICERGTRSAEAVRFLAARGRRLRYVGGGLHWRSGLASGDGDSEA